MTALEEKTDISLIFLDVLFLLHLATYYQS